MIDEITLTNKATGKTIILGKNGWQEFWLENIDWGQIEGSHNVYSSYNVPGDTVISTRILTRPVSITGWIISDITKSVDERAAVLNKFISPEYDYTIGYDKYQLEFKPDTSIVYGRGNHQVSNDQMRKFQIVGTSHKPFFEEKSATKSLFEDIEKTFVFPTDFGYEEPLIFGIFNQAGSKLINNTGSCAVGVLIHIEFTDTVTNPRIQDLSTLEYIQVNTDFVNGDILEINTENGNKSIQVAHANGSTEDYLRYRDPSMTWLKLNPGYNDWNLSASLDGMVQNMSVSVTFTPRHLEVE